MNLWDAYVLCTDQYETIASDLIDSLYSKAMCMIVNAFK